jgi:hypothetical protein
MSVVRLALRLALFASVLPAACGNDSSTMEEATSSACGNTFNGLHLSTTTSDVCRLASARLSDCDGLADGVTATDYEATCTSATSEFSQNDASAFVEDSCDCLDEKDCDSFQLCYQQAIGKYSQSGDVGSG